LRRIGALFSRIARRAPLLSPLDGLDRSSVVRRSWTVSGRLPIFLGPTEMIKKKKKIGPVWARQRTELTQQNAADTVPESRSVALKTFRANFASFVLSQILLTIALGRLRRLEIIGVMLSSISHFAVVSTWDGRVRVTLGHRCVLLPPRSLELGGEGLSAAG